jgi:hypothetical protein
MVMTRKDPPPRGGDDHLSDPKKRDPGTADDEFARFREQRLAKRRQTKRNQRTSSSKPLSAQERARQEILGIEKRKERRSASRAASREALARAREEMKAKQERMSQETRTGPRRPSTKLSRETMLRGRAEIHARDKHEDETTTFRRPSGKLSREAFDRAKREREAMDEAQGLRAGKRRKRLDPPSDPAVRSPGTADEEFAKFRQVQLRRKKLEALGLDKNPDLNANPEESKGAFFGTTPVERQQIRGATASFRAEELEDLGAHEDQVVNELRPVEGTMEEVPDEPAPPPAPDDWLDRMK